MGALMSCFALNIFECAACAACSCFATALNWTMAQASRFSHLAIVIITFAIAIIIGKSYPNSVTQYSQYTTLNLTEGCDSGYINECIYRQLIYRASLALVVVFTALSALSYVSDAINKGFWVLKLSCSVGLFVAFWWGDNSSFASYAEAIRVFSFIWLIIQSILLLDFSHDAQEYIMSKADGEAGESDGRFWYFLYLFICLSCLGVVVVGLAFLFLQYTGGPIGMFFTVFTLVMGIITTIVSLLPGVDRGLITPCILFAYSVFMCWYALLSFPNTSCNPFADSNNAAKDIATVIVAIVSMVIIFYCVLNGTRILNSLSLDDTAESTDSTKELNNILTTGSSAPKTESMERGEGAVAGDASGTQNSTESSGSKYERLFFHILMVLVSSYGGMVLTSWGSTTGTPESYNTGTAVVGNESMWFKIVSQWLLILMYCRVLQVAYQDNQS